MKPQDFFISARDFFAVIVPGALLMIVAGAISPRLNLWLLLHGGGAGIDYNVLKILICLVFTYSIGTLLGGVGSLLDGLADKITAIMMQRVGERDRIGFGFRKIERLRQTESLARNLEVSLVPGIHHIETHSRPWSTRAFWWNYLRLNCAEAMVELDRVEGQQKQFRSMAVAGAVVTLILCRYEQFGYCIYSVSAMLMLAIVYWSYRNRFARRLFELAIVFAVPKERFGGAGSSFFELAAKWPEITAHASRTDVGSVGDRGGS